MEGKKTLIKNSIFFTIAPFVPKVVSVVLLPIMTKYLTATDYGIAGTIAAYSQSIGALSTLGLSVVLMNSFYKNPDNYKAIWKRIYGFLNCWMVIYALLQSLILFFCIPDEALENRWWIIVLTNITTIFFGPTAQIGSAYFTYTKQSVPIVWRSIMEALITTLSTFYLIVYMNTGYMGWYIGGFIGTLFCNATYWPIVNIKLSFRPSYKFSVAELKRYLAVSIPTIPHSYTSYLMDGSARMILNYYGEAQSNIGRLSIAQQIGGMFQIGVLGISQAVTPYFMSFIRGKDWSNYKRLSYLYIGVVFSTAFIVSIWSKEIFHILLSNEELANTYKYGIIFIMSTCYRPLYVISSNFNFYFEKTKQLLLTTCLSGVIAMILYTIFTPLYGIAAFFICYYIACLYYGYSGFFFSCYKENSPIRLYVLVILLIQIILTILAYICVELLIIKILITSCFIIFLLCSYKKIANILDNITTGQ